MKKYRLGKGKLLDGVMKLITDPNADPEGLRLLNKVMGNPEAATKLFELMVKDVTGKKRAPRKKMRRGIGTY